MSRLMILGPEGGVWLRLDPDRFHEVVRDKYGSLDAWLEAEIGVDDSLRARLRERYLA